MSVELLGAKKAISQLRTLRARMRDTTPLMRELAIKMHQRTIVHFVKEEDPDGHLWKKSKHEIRTGGQTLTDTGRLRASVRFAYTRTSAEVFTNTIVYAARHNYGILRMPRREFIGFGRADEKVIAAIAAKYLKSAI